MSLLRIQRPAFWSCSPAARFSSLQDEVSKLFAAPLSELARSADYYGTWSPAFDVSEDQESFAVKVELPGLKKEEISTWFEEDVLHISGERKPEPVAEDVEVHRVERAYGKFHRSVAFSKPVTAEQIKASYQDGILTVTLPKAVEAKPKPVNVKVN